MKILLYRLAQIKQTGVDMDVSGIFKAYHEKKLVFETKLNLKYKSYMCGEEFCISIPEGHEPFTYDAFEIHAEDQLICKHVLRTGVIHLAETTTFTLTSRITASEGWEPKKVSKW